MSRKQRGRGTFPETLPGAPEAAGSAVLPCIYTGHTSQAQPTSGSVSLFLRPRLDEKWPFNSRFGSSGDTGDPTNDPTFLCA